jgi:hypothetical protein
VNIDSVINIIISTLISSGIIILFVKSSIKGIITHYFNKNLENHKHELTLITEAIRLDHQRKIHDFSLYSNKKHEVYPEIFKMLLNSFRKIRFFKEDTYLSLKFINNKEQLYRYLEAIVGETKMNNFHEIINDWDKSPQDCIHRASLSLKKIIAQEANEYFKETYDFILSNQLFLSDVVSENIEIIGMDIASLITLCSTRYHEELEEFESMVNKIEEGLRILKENMKKELAIGNYNS